MERYAGQEMAFEAKWRDDPQNAPVGEWLLTFSQGGITIRQLDKLGNWRGRSGAISGEPGRMVLAPSHWMHLPDPPFAPLGSESPRKLRDGKRRESEGLSGAI